MAQGTESRFQTTRWSRVLAARHSSPELGELLQEYRGPIYSFIRRKWRPQPEDAEDLTQGFIQHLLEKDVISRADPARGRFRAFLLAVLSNFRVDEIRKPANRNHAWTPADLEALEPCGEDSPEVAAERQYWAEVVSKALLELESDCLRQGMQKQWLIFERSTVGPMVRGAAEPATDELMAATGLQTEQQIYSVRQTMNRKFERALRGVISDTVDDSAMIDDEMLALRQLLSI